MQTIQYYVRPDMTGYTSRVCVMISHKSPRRPPHSSPLIVLLTPVSTYKALVSPYPSTPCPAVMSDGRCRHHLILLAASLLLLLPAPALPVPRHHRPHPPAPRSFLDFLTAGRPHKRTKCLFNNLAYNCDFQVGFWRVTRLRFPRLLQDAIGAANEAAYWGSSSPGKRGGVGAWRDPVQTLAAPVWMPSPPGPLYD